MMTGQKRVSKVSMSLFLFLYAILVILPGSCSKEPPTLNAEDRKIIRKLMAAYDMLNHQQRNDMIDSEAMLQYDAAVRELEELPPGVPGVSNLRQACRRYKEAAENLQISLEVTSEAITSAVVEAVGRETVWIDRNYRNAKTKALEEELDRSQNEYDMALKDLESICEKLVRRDIQ